MSPYAQDTKVPVDRSRNEIERILVRFKASGFAYAWRGEKEQVEFEYADKHVRVEVPMPDKLKYDQRRYDQERRRRWRAAAMIIKAKVVAIEDGITTFEHEFLSYFVMPGGMTIGEAVIPRLNQAALHGVLPPLLEDHRMTDDERSRL